MTDASMARLSVNINRYTHAFCVLVLMPTGVVQTAQDPSDYHLILLAATTAWTALVGLWRRRSIARWMEKDDD